MGTATAYLRVDIGDGGIPIKLRGVLFEGDSGKARCHANMAVRRATAQQAYKPSPVPPRPGQGAVTINLG
jgi:hypothetical protein